MLSVWSGALYNLIGKAEAPPAWEYWVNPGGGLQKPRTLGKRTCHPEPQMQVALQQYLQYLQKFRSRQYSLPFRDNAAIHKNLISIHVFFSFLDYRLIRNGLRTPNGFSRRQIVEVIARD